MIQTKRHNNLKSTYKRQRNLLMNWSSVQSADSLVPFCQPGTTRGFILGGCIDRSQVAVARKQAISIVPDLHHLPSAISTERHSDLLRSANDTAALETTRGSISSHANKTLSTLAPTTILPILCFQHSPRFSPISILAAYISHQGVALDNWGVHLWSRKQAIIISNRVQICTSIGSYVFTKNHI